MALLTPASAREALKAVIDPEIYQNIVDLGLVYDIEVDPDRAVNVTMTLTTPHCPLGPQIIEDVETTLRQQGANQVDVQIVWEPMWTPDAMTDDLKRQLGILDDEEDDPYEEPMRLELPPPPPKKKGLLSRIFG
jgi:metal-sulfur cluster biosynthetic enzyme